MTVPDPPLWGVGHPRCEKLECLWIDVDANVDQQGELARGRLEPVKPSQETTLVLLGDLDHGVPTAQALDLRRAAVRRPVIDDHDLGMFPTGDIECLFDPADRRRTHCSALYTGTTTDSEGNSRRPAAAASGPIMAASPWLRRATQWWDASWPTA